MNSSQRASHWIERIMKNWRIVWTLVIVLVGFGTVSFLTMPRQEFPEFTVRQGLVIGVMPGASSEEVEERLTRVVENYLFRFREVDKTKTYSVSQEGQVVVFVELNKDVKGAEAPAFWAKLRHGLNELKTQKLPREVVALIGNNDFGDTSAVLLTLVSEGSSPRDLEKQMEVLESHLRRLPATSKLQRLGEQKEVLRVSISRDRLARYGVRPLTVWSSLQSLGELPAAARLDGEVLEMPVRVDSRLRSEQELEETILLSDPTGPQVRLKDVATITREYGHESSKIRADGQTALVLSVEMQRGYDITHFGRQVDAAMVEARKELPPQVQIHRIADQPHVVSASMNHFLRDFGLAIVSVILVTLLLLPVRVAAVAAVTIPICVMITLGILRLLQIDLQTVSLAGLIVVLGMVVDNAIVVIDDHVEKLDHGLSPWEAAWQSARDLSVPVFTATLAIILAYAPLTLFLQGVAGDFVQSLPVTIAVALLVSLVLAVTLVPILNARFIRQGLRAAQERKEERRSFLDVVQRLYDATLEKAFRFPRMTLLAGVGSVVLALLLAFSLSQQLFPKADRDQFAVEVYLPPGRSLQQTDAVVRQLEASLRADERVRHVTSFIGASSPRFHTLYAPNLPGRNYAQLIVNTISEQATLDLLKENEARSAGQFPDAWVRWKQLDMQSARAPIEIRLSGLERERLKSLAVQIEQELRSLPGVLWVRHDFAEPLQGIEVAPDIEKSTRLGVSPAALQLSLALGTSSGVPVATLWEGDYPVQVLLAEDQKDSQTLEGLRQQYVTSTWAGGTIPVEQIAQVRPTWSEGAIVRRNGVPTLTVRVDVEFGIFANQVQKLVEEKLASLELGEGVRLEYGGEKEGSIENYVPLGKSLLLSVALIYLVLLFQLKRHKQTLLVMLTMPLALLGAVFGLVVLGYPFGLTAFVGVISLMGIVVRNGIILVGYAEELRTQQGLSVKEAARAAGQRRMRPIVLTSVAAAVGVVPMILGGSTLWGPLGSVTGFGLIVAMLLTLIVLPVAYWRLLESRGGTSASADSAAWKRTAVVGLFGLSWILVPGIAQAQEGPLTLEKCKELTLQHNSQVRQAGFQVREAEQIKKAAATKYFPQVSAQGLALTGTSPFASLAVPGGNLPVFDGNPVNLPGATQFAYSPGAQIELSGPILMGSLTAIQPIYAGGRIRAGNELAQAGISVAQAQKRLKERDALLETEKKYWNFLALQEKQQTLESYESLLRVLEQQVEDAVSSGVATRNDLLKVQLQRRKTEVDRLQLESGLRLSARDLRRHLGLPEGDSVQLADALSAPEEPRRHRGSGESVAEGRVELALLNQADQAQKLQSKMKQAEALPTLALGAGLYHLRAGELGASSNAIVFGVVEIPVSAWWERHHQREAEEARSGIFAEQKAEARSLIALEVEKSWDELQVAWLAARTTEVSLEQAAVHLAEVKDQHENGLVPLSELLEAEVLQRQALEQRIDSWRNYWIARASYEKAINQSLPKM